MSKGQLIFTSDIQLEFINYCQQINKSHFVFICDENSFKFCLTYFKNVENVIVVSVGEQFKNIETYSYILEQLIKFKANRKTLIINLGGGIITDIGGFVASTFMRGVDFINIPTTLVGMVDAAIGGKTGVDFNTYKNYLGTFSLPERVFIFQDFLKTLPELEVQGGKAELIKCGIIANEMLFNKIITGEELQVLIPLAAATKQELVEQDFRDVGIRQLLNFGHTIGHAYESYCLKEKISVHHGIAVAKGMMAEAKIAHHLKMLNDAELNSILNAIETFTGQIEFTLNEFLSFKYLLHLDKKNTTNDIVFSLPTTIGKGKSGVSLSINQVDSILFNA